MAIAQNKPLFDFIKYGIKTDALETHIGTIRAELNRRGVQTDNFTIRMPHPLMCLWTTRQRERLLKRATGFEGVLVLGCHSAAMTARDALKETDCKVFLGMREIGLTNATVKYKSPAKIELEVHPLPNTPFGRAKQQDTARGSN